MSTTDVATLAFRAKPTTAGVVVTNVQKDGSFQTEASLEPAAKHDDPNELQTALTNRLTASGATVVVTK